jgi:hypothetical protein
MDPAPATTYRAHPRYALFTLIAAVLALLFAWDLRRGVEMGGLLFLGVALALLVWNARGWGSRVILEPRRLRVQRPLSRAAVVEFRQLAAVNAEGRFGQSILLHYHPLAADGLVALDEMRSLALPALREQATVLDILQKQVPA